MNEIKTQGPLFEGTGLKTTEEEFSMEMKIFVRPQNYSNWDEIGLPQAIEKRHSVRQTERFGQHVNFGKAPLSNGAGTPGAR